MPANLRIRGRRLHAAVGAVGAHGDGVLARCRNGPIPMASPTPMLRAKLAGTFDVAHLLLAGVCADKDDLDPAVQ